jgi:hypothetical protein
MSKIFVVVCAVVAALILPRFTFAADKTYECHAVQNEATLLGSDRLIVSTASDKDKKFCRFFVSLPPPSASRNSASVWFNAFAANADAKMILDSIVDLAVAPIPKDDARSKQVTLRIQKNSALIQDCVTFLLKNGAFNKQSEDRTVTCSVPPKATELLLTVSLDEKFISSLALPRPS